MRLEAMGVKLTHGNRFLVVPALCLVALLAGTLPARAADVPDVYYAGFAYAGRHGDIEKNFRFTREIETSAPGAADELETSFRELFKSLSKDICSYNLRLDAKAESGGAGGDVLAMAVAVTREDVATETMRDGIKVVLNLNVKVMFLNLTTKSFVGSYPVHIEKVDFLKEPPGDDYKRRLVRDAYFGSGSSIRSLFRAELPASKVGFAHVRTVQVKLCRIEDKVCDIMFSGDRGHGDAYSSLVAQSFSDELVKTLGLTVLPFGRDAVNGKMSLVYADGKEQDFTIPEPSYSIELSLNNVKKKELSSTAAERAIAFGAFLGVKVFEPESNTVFFEKEVFNGEAKKVAATSGDFDELPVYRELVTRTVAKAINEMKGDRRFKSDVLKKCVP